MLAEEAINVMIKGGGEPPEPVIKNINTYLFDATGISSVLTDNVLYYNITADEYSLKISTAGDKNVVIRVVEPDYEPSQQYHVNVKLPNVKVLICG